MSDRAGELFETMRTVASIGITWWAAGLIACASLLAGAWARRHEIRAVRRWAQHGLFALIGLFLLTVVGFGGLMVYLSSHLGADLKDACLVDHCQGEASVMTHGMVWGFAIGTTSFVGCLIAWVVAWVEIRSIAPTSAKVALLETVDAGG